VTVGDRIRWARKAIGLTQEELGQRLGTTQSMIGQYERGVRNPKYDLIERFADALDQPVEALLGIGEFTDYALEGIRPVSGRDLEELNKVLIGISSANLKKTKIDTAEVVKMRLHGDPIIWRFLVEYLGLTPDEADQVTHYIDYILTKRNDTSNHDGDPQ
jgi:transcriptional regulator with XRE-family HTH domain